MVENSAGAPQDGAGVWGALRKEVPRRFERVVSHVAGSPGDPG